MWPADLVSDATTLMNVLTDLYVALTDDNLEEAAPLATQAHEVQHDLSHGAEHWIEHFTVTSGNSTSGQANSVTTPAVFLPRLTWQTRRTLITTFE